MSNKPTEEQKAWFSKLPKWLQWLVRILIAALVTIGVITGYGLSSCGNTKILLRNANSSSVTQQGSDIEVTVSSRLDSISFNGFRKVK